ncbi:MAG: MlaD family protein [Planctomycetota bacterium]
MSKQANPTLIGGFVLVACALAIAMIVAFGGGDFFKQRRLWVSYFDESLKGLRIGSSVLFNGVRIGEVVDFAVIFDKDNLTGRTPVYFEVDTNKIQGLAEIGEGEARRKIEEVLIHKRGLRATLSVESMVTGQLQVELNFYDPEKVGPPRLVAIEETVPEMPTIQTGFMKKFETVADRLDVALDDLHVYINDHLTPATDRIGPLLDEYREFGGRLNKRIGPLVDNVEGTFAEAKATFAEATATLTQIKDTVERAEGKIDEAVASLDATLVSWKKVGDTLEPEIKPVSKQVEEAVAEAKAALVDAKRTFANIKALTAEDSRTVVELNRALKEIGVAARAIGELADQLERHPESVLGGKKGKH